MDALIVEPAIADFNEALKYREDDWAAWNNLGCCYKYIGEYEKAIEHLEKAVECLKDFHKTGMKSQAISEMLSKIMSDKSLN